jgi:hypothetical protein
MHSIPPLQNWAIWVYGRPMNIIDSYGAGKLKQAAVTDIQKTIAEALSKLTDQAPESLLVSIGSMEFSGLGHLKITLSVDPNHDWSSAQIQKQVEADPDATKNIPF